MLDDPAQTYTRDELRFLWALAARLPGGLVLRAAHDHQPPSPLQLALDFRIVTGMKVIGPNDDKEALIRRYQTMLTNGAAKTLTDLKSQYERTRGEQANQGAQQTDGSDPEIREAWNRSLHRGF